MKPRFFIDTPLFPSSGVHENLMNLQKPALMHQIVHVLRIKKGEEIILLDNSGFEFLCRIEKISQGAVSVRILQKTQNENEPKINVILYQALPKKLSLFELVLQKCTEIGVKTFVPLITERTERKELKKSERLKKIIKEAAEQSERGILPDLSPQITFKDAIQKLNSRGEKIIVCDKSGQPLVSFFSSKERTPGDIHLFIGPEGGFSQNEIEFAKEHSAIIASLCKTTLRTETAAIVASALIIN